MDAKLYQLTQKYRELQEIAEDLDEQTFLDTLESIEDSMENKVESIVKMLKYWESNVQAIDEEIKRLTQRKKVFSNKGEQLKTYLQIQLHHANKKKIETPMHTVSIRNNPPSVKITDENFIPKEFLVPQPPKINKTELGKFLKAGNQILGAELEYKKSLQIK